MNKSSLPHTALTNLKRRTNLLGLDDYPGNRREPNASPEPRKQSCQYFALSEPEPDTVLLSRYGKEIVSQVFCSIRTRIIHCVAVQVWKGNILTNRSQYFGPLHQETKSIRSWHHFCVGGYKYLLYFMHTFFYFSNKTNLMMLCQPHIRYQLTHQLKCEGQGGVTRTQLSGNARVITLQLPVS